MTAKRRVVRRRPLGGINDSVAPENPDEALLVVTYWAISIITSRTAQFAMLTTVLGIISIPEVWGLIPLRYLPVALAVVGVINFGLRKLTTRPAAFIAPGATKPVDVPKLKPPAPIVTD